MRQHPTQRGYNREWRRAAEEFRWHNPCCLGCLTLGRKTRAEMVDHIVPHKGNPTLFWDRHNWQSLCNWHHVSIKPILERLYAAGQITAADLRMSSMTASKLSRERFKAPVGIDGFAINGC